MHGPTKSASAKPFTLGHGFEFAALLVLTPCTYSVGGIVRRPNLGEAGQQVNIVANHFKVRFVVYNSMQVYWQVYNTCTGGQGIRRIDSPSSYLSKLLLSSLCSYVRCLPLPQSSCMMSALNDNDVSQHMPQVSNRQKEL
jgi:hypothetical protein